MSTTNEHRKQFENFVKSHPRNEEINHTNFSSCAIGQFAKIIERGNVETLCLLCECEDENPRLHGYGVDDVNSLTVYDSLNYSGRMIYVNEFGHIKTEDVVIKTYGDLADALDGKLKFIKD
jgi:hypothetical protein